MANQGFLAQLKPTGATNTLLYSSPVDQSASTVLNVANDGTGSAYNVAVKNYDQQLTVDASGYLLHPGDVITSYYITTDAAMTASSGFVPGQLITTEDQEKTFRFESFYVPEYTEIFVKTASLRSITVESLTGTFDVGDTISIGATPNTTTATIFGSYNLAGTNFVVVGPSTIAGTGGGSGAGGEFFDGDIITATGNSATATISSGGITAASNEFIFSTTTAGGVYNVHIFDALTTLTDRAYRFNVADATMTGRDFKLSITVNGEWGADGVIGGVSPDDGQEYILGKTSNGTAGSAGAYVQYNFVAGGSSLPSTLYFYDGGTGTASNADYGGSDRYLTMNFASSFNDLYIYDVSGTLAPNTDTFVVSGVTYTITAQNVGPYGYVRSYSGTTLEVIKGVGSTDFAANDKFRDNPKLTLGADRSTVEVSTVDIDVTDVEDHHYIIIDKDNSANNIDKTTSLVVGPGERIIVSSDTANNVFSLIGFEDTSSSFETRVFGAS
jgi:hypothetical protein